MTTILNVPESAFLSAVVRRVEYRRGKVEVKVRVEPLLKEEKIGVALKIRDKWAIRKVDNRENARLVIDEMIDELWPLEVL